ncbi:hypothetical protein BDZ90DRAFT_257381 [Jaminaea rosea]|uniref:Branchpoint-bridging protein n=1 Tax=Jaminaea rosea TaxID=1569628 RepID=A0A316UYA9_9BASI|nr:hypothetical protein BDZ90DRAFT_257381 [Jaminaea rosea]PWN30296.1 hypothetical protein BDZ90DRAFT_257381 [Jaminaea rosea]
MSWRNNSQRTGENAAPLQNARRWGGGGGAGGASDGYAPPPMATSASYGQDAAAMAAAARAAEIAAKLAGGGGVYGGEKRDRAGSDGSPAGGDDAPRKRRSRWGDAAPTTGVTTAITGAVNVADLDRYALSVRLDEISRKLQTGDVVPPDRERSPSPPPIYDGQGRRTNTREVRYRKKLEDERVQIVDKQLKLDPNYRPPAEYHASKRNRQPQEKVYLPLKEFPEINFFGLLVGPRGNTLKGMERQSGAKIAIRGKGSVKEGKGRGGDEDEEDMHCVITADDDAKVKHCIQLINKVIETAASTPESQNDHKRSQLRELATLNGTLRDDENQVCQNCGAKGHRRFECNEQRNYTAHITCHRCGGQGHLARDCTQPRQGFGPPGMGPGGFGGGGMPGGPQQPGGPNGGGGFDSEYASLMAELGEGGAGRGGSGTPMGAMAGGPGGPSAQQPGGPSNGTQQQQQQQPQLGPDGKKIPPWRQPDIWSTPGFSGPGGGGGFGGPRRGGYGGGFGGHHGGGFGGPAAATGANAYGPTGGQGWAGAGGAGGYGAHAAGGYGQAAGADGHQQQQQGQQQDYSAEWAAYYAQQAQQQQQGTGADPAAQQGGTAQGAAAGGEQKDYSKEWEEYYRQQALLQQQQQGGGGGGY